MNFWDMITGNDMKKEMNGFDARIGKLPAEYQDAWEEIKTNTWSHSDLTGRNLMPILNGMVGLLEDGAADGQSVSELLGEDIKGFCAAVAGEEGAKSYRDKWRKQLNSNVSRKLAKLDK